MTESATPTEPTSAADQSPVGPRPLFRDWRAQMWAIMIIALIPRLIYLAQIRSWIFFYHPILDSRVQNEWARTVVSTLGVGGIDVLAKPPLYTYFLAACQVAVGQGAASLFAARLAQLVLGAVTCGLAFLVGRRIFGTAVGIIAGLLLALYSPGVFNDGELLDTALATFLATCFLLALLASLDRPTGPRWFGAGLLLGLLGLARGNLLLLAALALVLLFAWLRRTSARDELTHLAAVFLVGIVVAIVPITVRNAILTGGFIPVATNGGINFYTGNNPEADGYSPIPAGALWERTWYEQTNAAAWTHRQQENYWFRKGLSFVAHHPGRTLSLLVKKAYLYWAAYDIPNNLSYAWGREHAPLLRLLPFTFALLGPLGLLGIALGGRRGRTVWIVTLFIAAQMLSVIIFFVNGRYRMPALPAICVLAAFALVELARLARSRQWPPLAASLIALGIFGALLNADLYGVARARGANRDWVYLGQSQMDQGAPTQALEAFRQGTAADPQDVDAWTYLAYAAMQTGDLRTADRAFHRALDLAPYYATAASRYASLCLSQGWPLADAQRFLQRALQDQPTNIYGLAALVRVNVKQGQREQASANLGRLVAAFSRWNRGSSRYDSAQMLVQQAANEAAAAGIPPPAGPPPVSGGGSGGSGGFPAE